MQEHPADPDRPTWGLWKPKDETGGYSSIIISKPRDENDRYSSLLVWKTKDELLDTPLLWYA